MSSCLAIAGTKFSPPTPFHTLLHRQRLHNLLDRGLAYPLTLLSAPAGYGKTSALSEWLLTLQGQYASAWVSLDTTDDTVHRFWLCVLLALQRCAPDVIEPILSLWQEQQTGESEHMLSLLINRLLEKPQARYILILDDYHLVTEPAIHQSLTYLIERLPPQLRLILTARCDPPLSLPRLRARGMLLEVRTEHLQCTLAEAEAFFHEIMGLSLSHEEVAQITQRTEGWLVGLQLIALSFQDQAHLSEVLTRASGDQRYILDYLIEEVLKQQPEHLQRFLLITSLLDELCVPLCDMLWDEGQSQSLLELLERKHLFVVALDEEGLWYRYHHLFAEALRHRLHQSLQQEEIDALYGKASRWYEEQGQTNEAVYYAVQGHDWQRVITLLGNIFQTVRWQAGELGMMQWWIKQLPIELFRQHASLGLFAAWLWFCIGNFHVSDAWLEQVEIALSHMSESEQRRQCLAKLYALRAMSMAFYGQADESLALAEQASPLLNEDTYVPGLLKNAQALAFLARGEPRAALKAFQECISAYAQAGMQTTASCLSCIVQLYLLQLGQLKQAEYTLSQIEEEQQGQMDLSSFVQGMLYTRRAELLYEQHHLDRALDLAQQALHLMGQRDITLFVDRLLVVLIQIFLARQQFDEAGEILDRLRAFPTYRDNEYAQTWQFSGLQVRLWLSTGRQQLAVQWREHSQRQPPLPSVFAQECAAMVQVRVLLAEGKNEEARHLLATWLPRARKAERQAHVLEMCLLEALACQQLQQTQEALRALEEALALGEPEGYVHYFLAEGPNLVSLLQRYQGQKPGQYVDGLLATYRQREPITFRERPQSSVPHQQVLIEPLSQREREVLVLLAEGASNQEIAERLIIAQNTTKRHVQAILAKLGVHNRTQALVRAQELNLLATSR